MDENFNAALGGAAALVEQRAQGHAFLTRLQYGEERSLRKKVSPPPHMDAHLPAVQTLLN